MSDSRLADDERFLRCQDVLDRCGLSKTELYRRIRAETFPKWRTLPGSKISIWLLSEVRAWQAEQIGVMA